MNFDFPIPDTRREDPRYAGFGRTAGWSVAALLLVAALLAVPRAARAQEEPLPPSPSFRSPRGNLRAFAATEDLDSLPAGHHLDFRVYRVKDPVQFFAKLKDAHSFGSEKTGSRRKRRG